MSDKYFFSFAMLVGMFMNMANIPPRFYNQHQQAAMQAAKQSRKKPPPTQTMNKNSRSRGASQAGPLTQGKLYKLQGENRPFDV
jgi:hypothetical protein